MSKDCALIYPYLEDANWKNELRSKDNLALGYLTSCLRQEGFSVKMIHAEHNKYSITDIIRMLEIDTPKCIGISCTSQRAYVVVKEYAKMLKKHFNVPIFIGGIFPTIAYEKILEDCPDIDIVSLGEGEVSTVQYLKHITGNLNIEAIKGIAYRNSENQTVVNLPISVIENLDELPFPAKDYFEDMKTELSTGFYYINISAGRGCFGKCSFCSTSKLTGTSYRRVRSVDNVLDEISFFQKKYNVNYFKFVDELFIDKNNFSWLIEFCDKIKQRNLKFKFHAEARVDCINENIISKLKQCGLDELFIGLESGNQRILNQYRKGHSLKQAEDAIATIRKLGIKLQLGYIMIDPTLSIDELENNINWLLKIGVYSKHNLYNKLNLYYGTDLYYSFKEMQLSDNSPFYERKFTYFSDNRVECFSRIIDYCKENFSIYNNEINNFLLSIIKKGTNKHIWESISSEIEDKETYIWTQIILKAFEKAKLKDFNKSYWDSYLTDMLNYLYKNFHKIEREVLKLNE